MHLQIKGLWLQGKTFLLPVRVDNSEGRRWTSMAAAYGWRGATAAALSLVPSGKGSQVLGKLKEHTLHTDWGWLNKSFLVCCT